MRSVDPLMERVSRAVESISARALDLVAEGRADDLLGYLASFEYRSIDDAASRSPSILVPRRPK